jgi:hypothetical protein
MLWCSNGEIELLEFRVMHAWSKNLMHGYRVLDYLLVLFFSKCAPALLYVEIVVTSEWFFVRLLFLLELLSVIYQFSTILRWLFQTLGSNFLCTLIMQCLSFDIVMILMNNNQRYSIWNQSGICLIRIWGLSYLTSINARATHTCLCLYFILITCIFAKAYNC